MKRKNVFFVLTMVVFAVFVAISCAKNNPNGPLCINKIKLTETPTCTPDVSYTVYIHQEGTPATSVVLSLYSIDKGITLTAATGSGGTAGFPVHNGGQWKLSVNSFQGFDSQEFQVDPISNTVYAINYGIPTLELELVSGSETIHIAPGTIVYKITYHTKFQRLENIVSNLPQAIGFVPSDPPNVRKEGDTLTCTLNIPKSFEGYTESDKFLKFIITGNPTAGDSTFTGERTLTKNWTFSVTTEFHYMQVYDYDDNNGHISYYGGIKYTQYSLFDPGFVYTSNGISYEIIDAKNDGSDGTGTPVNPGLSVPAFADFGYFGPVNQGTLVKIPTNAGLDKNLKNDNNGSITVKFYYGADFDVKRTFRTETDWNPYICAHWCCTSRDVSRASYTCKDNLSMPCSTCSLWDSFRTADLSRERVGTINNIK